MESFSVYDRGLHYGDGFFETFTIDQHTPLCWFAHWQRIEKSCQRLQLPLPDESKLYHTALEKCQGIERGILKLIITRGEGGRGYQPPEKAKPNIIFLTYPWADYPPEYFNTGIHLTVCKTRLAEQPLLAGIKHLNRLEQVLARQELEQIPTVQEGVMLNYSEELVECTMSNLFWRKGEYIYTPSLDKSGVAGVMRGLILTTLTTWNIPYKEGIYTLDRLQQADEIFVCNSVLGIWGVRQLNDLCYKKGTLTQRLQHHILQQHWITAYA